MTAIKQSIEVLTILTDAEKDHISKYMARAFDKTDPGSWLATGQMYAEAPLAHKLFFRSIIDRAPHSGAVYTVSADRNAFAIRFLPGVRDRALDLTFTTPDDKAFNRWIAMSGGLEAVKSRMLPYSDAMSAARVSVYGKDGTEEHLRGDWLAVNPEYQYLGYARQLHQSNMLEAERLHCKVLFASCSRNVAMYEKIGGRVVGPEVKNPTTLPRAYAGWHTVRLMESGGSAIALALQSKPIVRVLQHIPDQDQLYMASWMARAFDKRDPISYFATGCLYEQDSKSHVLFFRSVIDRVPLCGGHFTVTTDNLCFASRFLPGVTDKVLDIDWKSGNDVHWNEWIARCGGYDAVKARLVAIGDVVQAETDRVYGKDGNVNHLRGGFLGCHPEHQKFGHARAIQDFNIAEPKTLGCKVLFGSSLKNVHIYRRIGGRPVGKVISSPIPLPPEYEGWESMTLMESGEDQPKAKL